MRYALPLKALAGFCAIVVAGCSGSSSGTSSVHIRCAGGESFCIISCDLGCTQTGCAVSEIAENQRLKFTFSSAVDPSSVNGSSFSIRTVTGVAPEGEVLVEQNVLTFAPRVRTVNGISTFGFRRNDTYIISMAGGTSGSFGLRSIAGDALSSEFSCTVVATRGIIDDDQLPPTVIMLAPEPNSVGAPRDPTIILRFSELIDTTPLRGTLTAASPVSFTLKTTQVNPATNARECLSSAQGLPLEGIPRLRTERVGSADVTVLEFKPPVLLPGNACVEVAVTADLRDLSGRPAIPAEFSFLTEEGSIVPVLISESFSDGDKLDVKVSGGTWSNGARPSYLGGDGRHGSFDYRLGSALSASVYTWDTTSIVIPATRSLTGLQYTVTDGKFYFTDFEVPDGITVNFVGPVPPQIWVRGQAAIVGSIKLNGAAMTRFNSRGATVGIQPFVAGQPGGLPGAGGGRGGKGGNECEGNGPIIQSGVILTDGQVGEDVRVPAGHGYAAQTVGTGGRGSTMNPPTGDNNYSMTQPLIGNLYRVYFAPGGSGGGYGGPGGVSSVSPPLAGIQVGPIPSGGLAFDVSSMSSVGYASLDHYLVGGSGGGGGATHNFGTIWPSNFDVYMAGSGGSGGGGAFALRVGGDLVVAATATCEVKGGAGVLINGKDPNNSVAGHDWGISSPGGGGSGGSILLQASGDLTVAGVLDASGGAGSRTGTIATLAVNQSSQAGAGSPGFFRLETAGSLNVTGSGHVPAYNASVHSGTLTDRDDFVGCTSLWYGSQQVFPPSWLRYELDVDTDGNGTTDITYTDTGEPGTQLANDPSGPLVIRFQGARLTQSTGEPDPQFPLGDWRFGIGSGVTSGIGDDSPTGFRFMIQFNRGAYPNCVVRGLRVYAEA